jgi:hypothetical protein
VINALVSIAEQILMAIGRAVLAEPSLRAA